MGIYIWFYDVCFLNNIWLWFFVSCLCVCGVNYGEFCCDYVYEVVGLVRISCLVFYS